ncbi:Rrp15p-domain-containing protein [Astrocystis sublimbata]|nr:Rrp15p-domain-containing protein [Astrocystis sublimbata]
MAGKPVKKRSHADSAAAAMGKQQRPKKKQRKGPAYHSDSDNEDLENALVHDLSGSDVHSDSDSDTPAYKPVKKPAKKTKNPATGSNMTRINTEDDGFDSDDHSNSDGEDGVGEDDDFLNSDGEMSNSGASKRAKSKRNDPDAFATSLQKILSTKLSNSKKPDAILSRSVDAQKASRQIVDATLESKARKLLRDQKLVALEKGRVKDVLAGDANEETSTGEIMATERRLRKTAHRGVIMLFRAVREAQERATEAEKGARKDGIIGHQARQEKVNEMSRQGFLDLIAGAGGKLMKGGLEDA